MEIGEDKHSISPYSKVIIIKPLTYEAVDETLIKVNLTNY